MKRIVLCAVLTACGDNHGSNDNAAKLFLAPDGSEIKLHLIESEPRPF